MEIYLIRHTTPKIAQGICYGQSDLELASNFDDEMASIHQNLDQSFDYIFETCGHFWHQSTAGTTIDGAQVW